MAFRAVNKLNYCPRLVLLQLTSNFSGLAKLYFIYVLEMNTCIVLVAELMGTEDLQPPPPPP